MENNNPNELRKEATADSKISLQDKLNAEIVSSLQEVLDGNSKNDFQEVLDGNSKSDFPEALGGNSENDFQESLGGNSENDFQEELNGKIWGLYSQNPDSIVEDFSHDESSNKFKSNGWDFLKTNLGKRLLFLDGGLGTMLQQNGMLPGDNSTAFGLRNPEILEKIHREYIRAGSNIICANSFGLNPLKKEDFDGPLEQAIAVTLGAARAAREKETSQVLIAFDIGPLGQLLEPMGALTFEEAYDAFKEAVVLAEAHGADVVFIETMTDLYEVKAAILATKENTNLPVFASMTFEENGRTFTGVSLETMAMTLEGLGVDAIGINCSLGPIEIYPLAEKLVSLTDLPVLIKPNAGLPDPETSQYDIDCDKFVESLASYKKLGVSMLGGCCGTSPAYISKLAKTVDTNYPVGETVNLSQIFEGKNFETKMGKSQICSGTKAITIDHVTVIGERINPTGKKRLREALLTSDYDYILTQAIEQIDAGAEILDVNVGVPSLDDVKVLPLIVKKLQSITDLPLQIDSSNPAAIEAALRVYNGKPIVNSVNGEDKVLDEILPLIKKYGAAVVGLTLDENGLPATALERFEIGKKILDRALSYGIKKEDVYIDCLALTASAQQDQVKETLAAIEMIKSQLGLKTVLGVSNVSFGLPTRGIVNRTFLSMAMQSGLDLPIINPNDEDMMASIFAFHVLNNHDQNAVSFIERYGNMEVSSLFQPSETGSLNGGALGLEVDTNGNLKANPTGRGKGNHDIFFAISKGLSTQAAEYTKSLLKEFPPLDIVNNHLIPALDVVGKGFENGTIYLPQMMQAAVAAQAGFDAIKDHLISSGEETVSLGTIAVATVKGDIHDIGKNIVKVIIENYGFDVIDLGKDVPPSEIVKVVQEHNLKLVGLSALMTTTLASMEETILEIKRVAPDCKVMVGGAVLTEDYAKKIGATYFCKDAMKSVEAAKEVFGV